MTSRTGHCATMCVPIPILARKTEQKTFLKNVCQAEIGAAFDRAAKHQRIRRRQAKAKDVLYRLNRQAQLSQHGSRQGHPDHL